jgi:tetratricopeptide (TPR) repeat protein
VRRLAPALALLALALAACAKRPAIEAETKPRLAKNDGAFSADTTTASASATASAAAKAAAESPDSSTSVWGDEFFKKGDYRRAIAYLSEAVKKNQSSAKLWRNLGSAYALAQDYDNAILCYERALKRNPHDIKTHYNLSLIHNFKGTPQELKLAEASAKQGLKEDPMHGPLHSSLGNIYADESKDDEALKEYQKALEINPKDPITRFNKGALHFKRREIKEAENEYYQTLKIDPKDAEAAQNLAAIYILQDRLDEAEQLNRWVIAQKPKDEDTLENAYFNLGLICDRQNKLEQGLNMYKLALQVAPWDAAAYVNTAVILERMNRKKEALTYWEKYQRLFPASRRAAEISSRIEILKKMVKSEKKVKVEE